MTEHLGNPAAGDLVNRNALVTGGSRGVGLAVGRRLVQYGASVALVARDRARLDAAVAELRAEADGARVVGIVGDVADPASMEAVAREAEARLGRLSILVNNAAIGRYGPVAEHAPDEWRQVIEVNLIGTFNATRAALPAIRRSGGGHVIAISSGAASTGYPNMTAYCASKAGLEGLMRALAAELANEPIKVTTVVPGGILTDFGIRTRAERQASGQKFIEPEDVADAVLFVLLQPARAWTQELNVWPR